MNINKMYRYSRLNKIFVYKQKIVIYSGLTDSFVTMSFKEFVRFLFKLKVRTLSKSEIGALKSGKK